MLNCMVTLQETLMSYQYQTIEFGLSFTMEYSLQELLDAQRKYFSDFDKADHRLRQTSPPSEGLKEISPFY